MCNCSCTNLGICLGNITYVIERLASCLAAAAVVSCLMATLLIMLGVGVGVGYNYCYVDTKLNETYKASKAYKKASREATSTTSSTNAPPGRRRRSKEHLFNQPMELQNFLVPPPTETPIKVRPTIVVPLKHYALMILIKDLQDRNKNVTLELIAARL